MASWQPVARFSARLENRIDWFAQSNRDVTRYDASAWPPGAISILNYFKWRFQTTPSKYRNLKTWTARCPMVGPCLIWQRWSSTQSLKNWTKSSLTRHAELFLDFGSVHLVQSAYNDKVNGSIDNRHDCHHVCMRCLDSELLERQSIRLCWKSIISRVGRL